MWSRDILRFLIAVTCFLAVNAPANATPLPLIDVRQRSFVSIHRNHRRIAVLTRSGGRVDLARGDLSTDARIGYVGVKIDDLVR